MVQLSVRQHRVQAPFSSTVLWAGPSVCENLLGEVCEAAKMTIPHSRIDAEAGHIWIWITLRQPFLRRAESAIPSRATRRSSIGCRKSPGSRSEEHTSELQSQ